MTHARAPDAFDIIQALLRRAPNVDAVEFVGAGPLEDLLTDPRTDQELFARVEQAVAQDARLALALSHVWVGASVNNDYQRDRLLTLGARDLSAGPAPGSSASE